MVFSSPFFEFVFLPFALVCYFALFRAGLPAQNLALALLGYCFYGWSSPQFLPLMLATTSFDWAISQAIARDDWRIWRHWSAPPAALEKGGARSLFQRRAIVISVFVNLGVLGFFKYFNFAAVNVATAFAALGLDASWAEHAIHVVLPLGISFYTFQSLSYTIDVYRGDARALPSIIDFACFVSMFPHLVAGPILKFSFLAEQLERRTITLEKFVRGASIFSLGLAKKALLANPCAELADRAFSADALSTTGAWLGSVAYSCQIYFDFGGYSDMAVGLGLMLGFIFARNFADPYQSESITEFWRRWHISLSTWLREYLYVPLGGNRRGPLRTYFNLLTTMVLGGLWHGASWTFVFWGALHGGLLAAERAGLGSWMLRLPRILRVAATLLQVLVAWVFFRSESLSHAFAYLHAMFLGGIGSHDATVVLDSVLVTPFYIAVLALALGVISLRVDAWQFTRNLDSRRLFACGTLFVLGTAILVTQGHNPFIYFIF